MSIHAQIEHLIDLAVAEDVSAGDITGEACIPEGASARAVLALKQSAVLAGLPFVEKIFQRVDPSTKVRLRVEEGSYHKAGTVIAEIEGPARGILAAERTVLNFVQHSSGVATLTRSFVRKVARYDCEVLDTRATLPGLRALEKYAVQVGGGHNHRFGLGPKDRFIIKKNYLNFLSKRNSQPISEGIARVIARKEQLSLRVPIEVEVRSLEELKEVLELPVDAVMLENMLPAECKKAVRLIHAKRKKAYIQSSSVTLETVREYAETGADGISIGLLTHSVEDVHISLRLTA